MPELPDRNPGEIIFASFSNQLIRRSVQRYADATQRDVENPLPEVGDVAYLTTAGTLQVWDGTFWTNYTEERQVWRTENRSSVELPLSGSPGTEINKIVLTGSNNRYQYLARASGYAHITSVPDGQLSQCFINLLRDSGSVAETAIFGVGHVTEPAPGTVTWSVAYEVSYVFAGTEPSISVHGYTANGVNEVEARNNLLTVEQIDPMV